jgi:peptide/nickel transport system substrate-binding protein
MRNYAEGLVTLDKDNNWIPCLAENWRWLDDRTIEFKLRRGVLFHNGEEFNAETVRVSWEQYRDMEYPRVNRWNRVPDETKFEVLDKYRVHFTMPQPHALAFVKFDWFFQIAPAFFKENKFDEQNYGYFPEAGPWGTGPFEVVEGSLRYGKPSERVVLKANENYWDLRYPKIQRVIFDNVLIGDRDGAMRLCRDTEGVVDIVSNIRPLDTLKVAESKYAKVVKNKDCTWIAGWFNQRKRGSKWRDIRLRRALNYAINRKELLRYCAKGNAHNLCGFIPPRAYGHNPDLTLFTYDVTRAKLLLAEAGYPNGFEVNIITPEAWSLEAQVIGKMLERIGLKVTTDVLTFPEWMQRTYIPLLKKPPEQQDWDLTFYRHDEHLGPNAAVFLGWCFLEEFDFRWTELETAYENMFKKMVTKVNREEQEAIIKQMVKYIYDHAQALFIYSPYTLYAVNREVDFVPQKSMWLRFKETSVTENHWSVRSENN